MFLSHTYLQDTTVAIAASARASAPITSLAAMVVTADSLASIQVPPALMMMTPPPFRQLKRSRAHRQQPALPDPVFLNSYRTGTAT